MNDERLKGMRYSLLRICGEKEGEKGGEKRGEKEELELSLEMAHLTNSRQSTGRNTTDAVHSSVKML